MPLQFENELLQAVAAGRTAAVAALLAAGADPNAGLFRDETALSIVVRNGSEEILDMLLQHGPMCCMREEYGDVPWTRFRYVLILKDLVIHIVKISLATYAVRKLAMSLPLGSLQTLALYGSRYLWFTYICSRESFISTTSLQRRYLNPLTHADTLMSMAIDHRINCFLVRQMLRFLIPRILPPLPVPMPPPTYIQDLAVALPLRCGIDVMATASRNLLITLGLIKFQQPRWTPVSLLPNSEPWRSPVERVLESVFASESVTEVMVLKLLQADTLVSQPYQRSEVARVLLGLAVNKCWPELTRFLISAGVLVDQEVSNASEELKLPAPSEAFACVLPSKSLHYLTAAYFRRRSVLDGFRRKYPFTLSISTFAQLVHSRRFQDLATSESEDNWADCKRMMNILRDGGANPLLTDDRGHDALSNLAGTSCSTDVLRHMAQLWRDARDNSENSDSVTSLALHRVINTMDPNLETLRILLDAGVSPECENEGVTPLFAAAYMNNTTDAMGLLFEFGANPNYGGTERDPPILRTLHDASYEKFVFMLDHGADPNGTQRDGKTILQMVLELKPQLVVLKAQLVKCLLERGSVVYDVTRQSSPPFLTAAREFSWVGWDEWIMDLLLKHIPTEQQQRQLDAALRVASCDNDSAFRNKCDVPATFYLLRKGANPASVEVGADSLLHLLCAAMWLEGHQYRDDMRKLLERGVLAVTARGRNGQFPVHHALQSGARDFMLLLLEHGADPNVVDANGWTALQQLCATEPEKYTISQGYTEVESDAEDGKYRGVRGHGAWKFEFRGRMLDIRRSLEQEEMFQALVDHGADIEVVDTRGRTLLMMACEKGNSVIAANILYRLGKERFAEAITTADHAGLTALHLAAANGDVNTLKALLNPLQILHPELNSWRTLAVQGEDSQRGKDSRSSEFATEQEMDRQALQYAKNMGFPGVMRQHVFNFEEPEEVTLTIGNARRSEAKNIHLPNVSMSIWTMDKREESVLGPEKLVDINWRTPLHYAAEKGRLEAMKLLVGYAGINDDVADKHGKKAADLALENNFYDVYSVLENLWS